MKMRPNLIIIVIALVASLLAGPSFAADQMLTSKERAMMKPDKDIKGVDHYGYPGFNIDDYPKVLIGAVTVYYADDSKSKAIDPEVLRLVTDNMRNTIILNIAQHVEIVDEPGPGVALINIAIVKVNYQNKKRGLLGYTPVGYLATTAANAANIRVGLADAKIQGETVDSVSGKNLTIFEVQQIKKTKKNMEWGDVVNALKDFARRAVEARYGQSK